MMNYSKIQNGFELTLNLEMHSKESILCVVYKFKKKFTVEVNFVSKAIIKVEILSKNDNVPQELDVNEFMNELNDEELRVEILQRTEKIREIIYEKAFIKVKEK